MKKHKTAQHLRKRDAGQRSGKYIAANKKKEKRGEDGRKTRRRKLNAPSPHCRVLVLAHFG